MLHLTCSLLSSVDLTHYGVSRTKDWISVDCGTMVVRRKETEQSNCQTFFPNMFFFFFFLSREVIKYINAIYFAKYMQTWQPYSF